MEKITNLPMKVAGVTFEGRQEILKMLAEMCEYAYDISLVREPNNTYDRNAIKVLTNPRGLSYQMFMIGYIPKEYAKYIAELMDAGATFSARIDNIDWMQKGGQRIYFCNIIINQEGK